MWHKRRTVIHIHAPARSVTRSLYSHTHSADAHTHKISHALITMTSTSATLPCTAWDCHLIMNMLRQISTQQGDFHSEYKSILFKMLITKCPQFRIPYQTVDYASTTNRWAARIYLFIYLKSLKRALTANRISNQASIHFCRWSGKHMITVCYCSWLKSWWFTLIHQSSSVYLPFSITPFLSVYK